MAVVGRNVQYSVESVTCSAGQCGTPPVSCWADVTKMRYKWILWLREIVSFQDNRLHCMKYRWTGEVNTFVVKLIEHSCLVRSHRL